MALPSAIEAARKSGRAGKSGGRAAIPPTAILFIEAPPPATQALSRSR